MNTIAYIQKVQKKVFDIVIRKQELFYLTGGTALVFQLKHRFSEDLDFFSQKYTAKEAGKIMKIISQETNFTYKMLNQENDPKFIPLTMYLLKLDNNHVLKIDFVQDFAPNLEPIKNGLHSLEDIFYRKINITFGKNPGLTDSTGKLVSTGRQAVKDILDLYVLSQNYMPLSQFFIRYFNSTAFEHLKAWYLGLPRMEFKLEMNYYASTIDPNEVLIHLDKEILFKLPKVLSKRKEE